MFWRGQPQCSGRGTLSPEGLPYLSTLVLKASSDWGEHLRRGARSVGLVEERAVRSKWEVAFGCSVEGQDLAKWERLKKMEQ